jgi:hypothetical protein
MGKRDNKEEERKNEKSALTLTGLLMEGVDRYAAGVSHKPCKWTGNLTRGLAP